MYSRDLQVGLERIKNLTDDEISQTHADLLNGLEDGNDPSQDDWFVYRGVSMLVPDLLSRQEKP